jgi:hypothetical protein
MLIHPASNSNSNSNASTIYSNYPEPSAENLANAAEFEENRRRYAQPIFAALDEISSKEADFIASQTINNLMDLFEALEKYKNEIESTDSYSVRESFRIVQDVYDRLIQDVRTSSNANISNKSNEFSRIIAEIYNDVQRKLGLAGGVLFRKKHPKTRKTRKTTRKHPKRSSKKSRKVLFRKKHGKKTKRSKKLTRKH